MHERNLCKSEMLNKLAGCWHATLPKMTLYNRCSSSILLVQIISYPISPLMLPKRNIGFKWTKEVWQNITIQFQLTISKKFILICACGLFYIILHQIDFENSLYGFPWEKCKSNTYIHCTSSRFKKVFLTLFEGA